MPAGRDHHRRRRRPDQALLPRGALRKADPRRGRAGRGALLCDDPRVPSGRESPRQEPVAACKPRAAGCGAGRRAREGGGTGRGRSPPFQLPGDESRRPFRRAGGAAGGGGLWPDAPEEHHGRLQGRLRQQRPGQDPRLSDQAPGHLADRRYQPLSQRVLHGAGAAVHGAAGGVCQAHGRAGVLAGL